MDQLVQLCPSFEENEVQSVQVTWLGTDTCNDDLEYQEAMSEIRKLSSQQNYNKKKF